MKLLEKLDDWVSKNIHIIEGFSIFVAVTGLVLSLVVGIMA